MLLLTASSGVRAANMFFLGTSAGDRLIDSNGNSLSLGLNYE